MSKLKKFFIALLAVTAAICLVIGFSACEEEVKINTLRIENARTEFLVGDEFELGDDFKVTAVYSDGKEEDVTDKVTYRQEAGMDMNVAGNYQITVVYGKKREIYTVYVGGFENLVRKIELDTANVKKQYQLGESVSFDGLKITVVSENAQGNLVNEVVESLKGFDVEIMGEDNSVSTEILMNLGKYTVTISKSGVKASYDISVDGVNISTVQGAVAAGGVFRTKVNGGRTEIKSSLGGRDFSPSYQYEYEFGDNYTYVKDALITPMQEFHYSIENGTIFCAMLQDGKLTTSPNIQASAMFGSPYHLWYLFETEYGIENAIANLYKHAVKCSNDDLKQTADEKSRKYSFSFSGLEFRSNNADYYETAVEFTLGADYSITSATYTQKYWENNDSYAGGQGYVPKFKTNASGKTYPTDPNDATAVIIAEATQTSGERTKKNPYSGDMLTVSSYDLVYGGKTLEENPVINCSMASASLTIEMSNFLPETASFEHDDLYLDYEGNLGGPVTGVNFLTCTGFMAYRKHGTNDLSVTLRNGGVWKLILTTSKTRKVITFNVRGVAPSSFDANVYNSVTGKFVAADSKTLAIGGEAYFRGAVNAYADSSQTFRITSANAADATVTEAELGGVKCFKFTAAKEGVYTVIVSSAAPGSSRSCTFKFTVSSAPDFAEILQGKYRTEDDLGNIYVLEFTPANEGDEVKGSLKITMTPTREEDGAPLYDQSKTEVLSYAVDMGSLSIVLTHVSGEILGVDLTVKIDGAFVLEDRYGTEYPLAVTE